MSTLPNYKTYIFSGSEQSIIGATPSSNDYLDIKWIGSTGVQYIVTDIVPKPTYNIEVKAQKQISTALFGVGGGYYSLTGKSSNNYFYVGTADATAANRQFVDCSDQSAVHIWGITNKIGYCDSNQATGLSGDLEQQDKLAFFGRNSDGAVSDLGTHRIYYAKIWDETGTLIGDFVPKIQLSTGKPGLYDNVTNKFYPNVGTGEFTYELENYQGILPQDSSGTNILENYKTNISY